MSNTDTLLDKTTLQKILDLGGFDSSKINVGNPIKILKIDTSNPKFVLGCYIMKHPEILDEFNEKCIFNYGHIDDYDILFFQPAHLYDLANIYYGILHSTKMQYSANITGFVQEFLNLLSKFPTYMDAIRFSRFDFEGYIPEEEAKAVKEALRYIPFLTYAQLDYYSQIAINTFLKELDAKNELNSSRSENTESA